MSPRTLSTLVLVAALLQMLGLAAHHAGTHGYAAMPAPAASLPSYSFDPAPLRQWVAEGLQAEAVAGALEDPDAALVRRQLEAAGGAQPR